MSERLKLFLDYVARNLQDPKFKKITDYLNDLGDNLDYMDASDWEDYCESDDFFDDVEYTTATIRRLMR